MLVSLVYNLVFNLFQEYPFTDVTQHLNVCKLIYMQEFFLIWWINENNIQSQVRIQHNKHTYAFWSTWHGHDHSQLAFLVTFLRTPGKNGSWGHNCSTQVLFIVLYTFSKLRCKIPKLKTPFKVRNRFFHTNSVPARCNINPRHVVSCSQYVNKGTEA